MEDEEFYPRSARTPAMSQSTGSGLESRATSISSLENEEGGCNRKDILYSRGMKDLLRPLAKGITHSLEEKKNPKETRRARKAIDKLNPQYIATKMTRDRQPITDELTQVKELLREEQEKNRQNNERHTELLRTISARMSDIEVAHMSTKNDLKHSLDNKLSPVKPLSIYPERDADKDMVTKAEKSLNQWVSNQKGNALYKVDGSTLQYLMQLNARSTEYQLSRKQTMSLLIKLLPVDSHVLTAVQEVRSEGLEAVFNRLTCRNAAVESLETLGRKLDNWFIPDAEKFGESYDHLLNIYKRLKPTDFNSLSDEDDPRGHKAFYEPILQKIESVCTGELKKDIATAISSLREMTDKDVAKTINLIITKLGNKIAHRPHELKNKKNQGAITRQVRTVSVEGRFPLDINGEQPETPHEIIQNQPNLITDNRSVYTNRIADLQPNNSNPTPFDKHYIPAWPPDKPVLQGKQITAEVIRHFAGACTKCGGKTHLSHQCWRYENEADSWTICELCRKGFHTVCLSNDKELWPKLIEHYGQQHLDRLQKTQEEINARRRTQENNNPRTNGLWKPQDPNRTPAFEGRPIRKGQLNPYFNKNPARPNPHLTHILRRQREEDLEKEHLQNQQERQQNWNERQHLQQGDGERFDENYNMNKLLNECNNMKQELRKHERQRQQDREEVLQTLRAQQEEVLKERRFREQLNKDREQRDRTNPPRILRREEVIEEPQQRGQYSAPRDLRSRPNNKPVDTPDYALDERDTELIRLIGDPGRMERLQTLHNLVTPHLSRGGNKQEKDSENC